jgi:hypothetical protein
MQTAPLDNVNSAVLNALLNASDLKYPGLGPHPDEWRRWWATEKKNRDVQKRRSTARAVSQSPLAHDSTTQSKEGASR